MKLEIASHEAAETARYWHVIYAVALGFLLPALGFAGLALLVIYAPSREIASEILPGWKSALSLLSAGGLFGGLYAGLMKFLVVNHRYSRRAASERRTQRYVLMLGLSDDDDMMKLQHALSIPEVDREPSFLDRLGNMINGSSRKGDHNKTDRVPM